MLIPRPSIKGVLVQRPSGVRYHPAAAREPPSQWIVVPVTQAESPVARKTAHPAVSSGTPKRPNGIHWATRSWCSGAIHSDGRICFVSVVSGAIALTRIPDGPSSRARLRVKPSMPSLKVA